MDVKEFEKYVKKSLKEIPAKFRDLMENITIEVDPDSLIFDKSHYLILGQYQGVSLPRRGSGYRNITPDKIVIFKKAFDKFPPEKLPELIANVLQHEIGHYFGMSEDELGKYKKV